MQRIAWRTDSCAECKGPSGEDLRGGYYEAGGSYLKFSFPTAFTLTQLAWGVVQYREGYAKVHCPITSGGMDWLPSHVSIAPHHFPLSCQDPVSVALVYWMQQLGMVESAAQNLPLSM